MVEEIGQQVSERHETPMQVKTTFIYAIYRLMVDHPRQNQGIGRRAMELLLSEIRACADARRITICYKPDNATARGFYASLGFNETGIDEVGEMVAEILL